MCSEIEDCMGMPARWFVSRSHGYMHPDGAGGMGPLQGRTTLKIEVALSAEFGKAPSADAHLWMHILSFRNSTWWACVSSTLAQKSALK